jgi:hypothetical protein
MASMDFYNLQNRYEFIIKEGYFHVPEKVLKDIKDFYIENAKKYIEEGGGKISMRKYPPKDFNLDFSGTNFEFLNSLNPSVTVYLTSRVSYFNWYNHENENTMESFNHGNIYLQLNRHMLKGVLNQVIEHEIMHYIQLLMEALHANYVGFPNKKLWRKGLDIHGNLNNGSGRRRVPHSQRPIEYYPDLLTAIRTLFQNYHDKIKRSPYYDILINNEMGKRYFFSDFLKCINDPEYSNDLFDKVVTIDTFREFKKISPEFYKKILKISYDAFVNGTPNFDPKELESQLEAIDPDL